MVGFTTCIKCIDLRYKVILTARIELLHLLLAHFMQDV